VSEPAGNYRILKICAIKQRFGCGIAPRQSSRLLEGIVINSILEIRNFAKSMNPIHITVQACVIAAIPAGTPIVPNGQRSGG
jgi:hypothetical protein